MLEMTWLYSAVYLSNKNVASSIQWLNGRCFHGYLHEPCNLFYDQLHDAKIVTDGDDGAKEDDCWKDLANKNTISAHGLHLP